MTASASRTSTARSGTAVLVACCAVIGMLLLLAGLGMAVLTAGSGASDVPFRLTSAAPAAPAPVTPCVRGASIDVFACEPAVTAEVWPENEALPSVQRAGGLRLSQSGVGPLTAMLSDAPAVVGLLASGVVVLLLVPVLRSTAAGRPFASGNARRIAMAATVTAGAWLVGHLLLLVAAARTIRSYVDNPVVLQAGTFAVPEGWLAVQPVPSTWWPLVVTVLLLGLAAAFRVGGRLADDADGLV